MFISQTKNKLYLEDILLDYFRLHFRSRYYPVLTPETPLHG
jgi:hypothetical protein